MVGRSAARATVGSSISGDGTGERRAGGAGADGFGTGTGAGSDAGVATGGDVGAPPWADPGGGGGIEMGVGGGGGKTGFCAGGGGGGPGGDRRPDIVRGQRRTNQRVRHRPARERGLADTKTGNASSAFPVSVCHYARGGRVIDTSARCHCLRR
jgi:hypothetical protein